MTFQHASQIEQSQQPEFVHDASAGGDSEYRGLSLPSRQPSFDVDRSSRVKSAQAMQERVARSPRVHAQTKLIALACPPVNQCDANSQAISQALTGESPEFGLLQCKFEPMPRAEEKSNRNFQQNKTGLPDKLKAGVESLSGISLDNVKVHYNSSKPAQINALAYAQGTDIHLAPGQEQHLPHEAWHIIQQAQGRVRPTMQTASGVSVNDDPVLEREADVMGALAVSLQDTSRFVEGPLRSATTTSQKKINYGADEQKMYDMTIPKGWHLYHATPRPDSIATGIDVNRSVSTQLGKGFYTSYFTDSISNYGYWVIRFEVLEAMKGQQVYSGKIKDAVEADKCRDMDDAVRNKIKGEWDVDNDFLYTPELTVKIDGQAIPHQVKLTKDGVKKIDQEKAIVNPGKKDERKLKKPFEPSLGSTTQKQVSSGVRDTSKRSTSPFGSSLWSAACLQQSFMTTQSSSMNVLQKVKINGIDVYIDDANYPVWNLLGIEWHLSFGETGKKHGIRMHITTQDRSASYWFTLEAGEVVCVKPTKSEKGRYPDKHKSLDEADPVVREFIVSHISDILKVKDRKPK